MPTPTPTLETAIAAVVTEIDAVNPSWGTVLDSGLKFESEIEAIEEYQQGPGANEWAIDLWVVTSEDPDEVEGDAPGENYSIYPIVCSYWNVRAGDASWEKTARQQVETIRDRLNQNASVFRIGGQIQLQTEEVAAVEKQKFEDVEGHKVYKARIRLNIEARRWA